MRSVTLDKFFDKNIEEKKTEREEESSEISEDLKDETEYERETINKLYSLRELKGLESSKSDELFLLSVEYDSEFNKAALKFYDPVSGEVYYLIDQTDHRPYFYSKKLSDELKRELKSKYGNKIIGFKDEEKYHPLLFRNIYVTKIIVSDPLAVGGKGGVREFFNEIDIWEAWIPYHLNYIYDRAIFPSIFYKTINGKMLPKVSEKDSRIKDLLEAVDPKLRKLAEKYAKIIFSRIPESIEYIALDIEVAGEGTIPHSEDPKYPIIAVSFSGYVRDGDGQRTELNMIFLLDRWGKIPSNSRTPYVESIKAVNSKQVTVRVYKNEKLLLLDTFVMMYRAPLLITFNGDNFDLRYILKRARFLGLPDRVIPIKISAKGNLREASVRYGLHIDLYKVFSNAAIKVYAFSNRYDTVSLDTLSEVFLGLRKVEVDKGDIETLDFEKLIEYSWWDAYLTASLFKYSNYLVFKTLVLLSRITRMPMFDLSRRGVSSWIENWLNAEHRERNYLIPNSAELSKKDRELSSGSPTLPPVIKGKKYRGAIVLTPKPGIWFNVVVLDFASIYPTIMKVHNISYETLCCPHEECKDNKVIFTINGKKVAPYWICRKKIGISSELIGLIRDIRVNYFKRKLKELTGLDREFYDVIQGALKVLINASYGVFGAEHFPLFSITVAETITGLGREKILMITNKAKEMNVDVIYGDTDSIFISNPDEKVINKLIEWSSKELKVDLEIDKVYRYVAFSARKKNYFGVLIDGAVDIKGLLGKKRNTPEFLKREFRAVIEILRSVESKEDMERALEAVKQRISDIFRRLNKREYNLSDLAFKVQLTKPVSAYTKTTPQHVKAAKKLQRTPRPGEIIEYVKTKSGVEPLEILIEKADWKREIDWQKYEEFAKSVFDQLLDALGLDIEKIITETKGVRDIRSFFS